jgi:NAD(P)-dependent dehydrogenase (short-subunit alcohol dehydrogenase family)
MTRIDSGTGTVLITGPTSGLGRDLTLELARRAAPDWPADAGWSPSG